MNCFQVRICLVAILLTMMTGKGLVAEDQSEGTRRAAIEKCTKDFDGTDTNKDGHLSIEEFLGNRNANEAKRDFLLFDRDADEFLSRDEFATIPTVIAPWFRGPIPDPMIELVDSVAATLDKSLNNWDKNPRKEIDAAGFIEAFAGRFAKQMQARQMNVREADQDGNGKVSRDEARRFLEIQLGVRRPDGKLLRESSGRVVNYMLYTYVDLNRNDKLERAEFMDRSYAGPNAAEEFAQVNQNKDDFLSFDEWCLLPWRGFTDPIVEFRRMDTNFDAYLDKDELMTGTEDWKRHLAKSAFPGFDLNKDGNLSLSEYRLTMQANMVSPWQNALDDTDGDGKLSFAEFRFDPPLFPLLRLVYYRRLDTNANGTLEPDEFTFKVKSPDEFFILDEDGTNLKSLFKFEGRPACGSPSISPDGKQLSFDAWPQGQMGGSAMYVKDLETNAPPRQVALGMMPNWSKDGKRLICSRNSPNSGVWMMDVEGDDHKFIGPGWGGQSSPDGSRIAYTQGQLLMLYDVENQESQTIFNGATAGYNQIYWNMGWSPDSRRICFKATKNDGTAEVAIVQASGDDPKPKVHYSTKNAINADFAWHPSGHRLVFATYSEERRMVQLFEFDPDKDAPPTLLKGQDPTKNQTDVCWTPDGKQLIIVSGDY